MFWTKLQRVLHGRIEASLSFSSSREQDAYKAEWI